MGWITLREAATRLGLSTQTIRRYVAAGELEAVRIGNVTRIEEEALERWLRSRVVQPTKKPTGNDNG